MNVAEFRELAMDSAGKYYRYLERTGRGVVRMAIKKITQEEDTFHLLLCTKLSEGSDIDMLLYAFDGRWHTSEEICPIRYHRDTNILVVRPKQEYLARFSAVTPDDLHLIADLKFLVKRVQNWYQMYGHRVSIPRTRPEIPPIVFPHGIDISLQQQEAIQGALSAPFSYIWGAPGTGKTRVVLSSCVLSLVLSNRRVLLLAPTNNALEQMLRAVIPICEQCNIPQSQILRVGTASSDFFQKYPLVCEGFEVEARIKSTTATIERLQKALHYRAFQKQMELAQSRIPVLLRKLQTLATLYHDSKQSSERTQFANAPLRSKQFLLCQDIEQLIVELEKHKKNIEQAGIFKKFFRHHWFVQEKNHYANKTEDLKRRNAMLYEIQERLAQAEAEQKKLEIRLTKVRDGFSARRNDLLAATNFWSPLQKCATVLTIDAVDSVQTAIMDELHRVEQTVAEKEGAYAKFQNTSEVELQSLLEKQTQRLAILQASSSEERLKHVKILACTIDKYLAQDPSVTMYSPHHVFLDEAGYISLIKSVPVCSMGVPLTFLGDHMQLPPICEMDDQEFQKDIHQSVCLWAQSALHAECIFTHTMQQLCHEYLCGETAPFLQMQLFPLDCTFRFGGQLSAILADMVYTCAFHSATPQGTELLVLDAPHRRNVSARQSEEELTAIRNFLLKYPMDDYAVLTPYRAQRSLLLSHLGENDILTVHASQGREWDTVFLSVVDTTDKWFTNSKCRESRGKAVINTAVSRAKKRLIIVCDYAYWRGLDEQLIGKLVQVARKV